MQDFTKRLDELTPQQRALVEKRLRERARKPSGPAAITPRGAMTAPLSLAQERLWFFEQLEPGTSLYHNPVALRMRGTLDVAALGRALDGVLSRHEALRTTFGEVDGESVAKVVPHACFALDTIDARPGAGEDVLAHARRLADAEVRRPFDLARGPLLRGLLVTIAPEDHLLVLTIHHIVSDGWSMGILIREVTALYLHFAFGEPNPLPPMQVQYGDYAAWERARSTDAGYAKELAYWKEALEAPIPALDLPMARRRPETASYLGGLRAFTVDAELAAAAQALAARSNATLYMTLLAVLATLLHRYTGAEDVVIGSPIAGRTRPETEGLIGFFLNSLALRTDLRGDPSFVELLARVVRVTLGAFDHQEVPFAKVVEASGVARERNRSPFFDVMFILQNAPMGRLRLPGLEAELVPVDLGATKLDLIVSMEPTAEGLSGWVEYSTALFDEAAVDCILAHYTRLLRAIVAEPHAKLSTFAFLAEGETLPRPAPAPLPAPLPRRSDVASWFYVPVWATRPLGEAAVGPARRYLLLGDESALSAELAAALRADGHSVVVARAGDAFARLGADVYAVRADVSDDYAALLHDQGADVPNAIVHLWGVGDEPSVALVQARGLCGLLALARALGQHAASFDLRVVTSGMHAVGDTRAMPAKATVLGPCRVIPQENPRIRCQSIDLAERGAAAIHAHSARELARELAADPADTVVAYRDGARLVRTFEPAPAGPVTPTAPPLRQGGTYLVTGGLGGIGLAVARYLARETKGNLVLVGRSGVRDERVARAVEELASFGGEVLVRAADVAMPRAIADVVAEARARFGRIDGVVHAAGVHTAAAIQNGAQKDAPAALAAKVFGTLALDAALADDPPDFAVLCSSAGSVLGGFAGATYCAANAFLDAFATARAGHPTRTIAIGWDAWRDVGMAAEADVRPELRALLATALETALSTEEGVEVFARALRSDHRHVVISTRDLVEVMRRPYFVLGLGSAAEIEDAIVAATHAREREVVGEFSAPETETEQEIAKIWQEMLSVEAVGRDDDFFDLGGHSLLTTRVIGRIRQRFAVNLPVATLFDAPTLRGISAAVDEARAAAAAPGQEREEIEL